MSLLINKPLNSYFSLARLCENTATDALCIELMLSVNVIRDEGAILQTLPEIIATREATPLECCLLFANECLTLSKSTLLCYGRIDSNLLQPLRNYLINETIIGDGCMTILLSTFENAYFVLVDNVCYIPHLFLKFDKLGVEFVEYCVNDVGTFNVNMNLTAWADINYQLGNAKKAYILKWFLPAALFQFKNRYPNKCAKLEFRDGIYEYYESRNDGLTKCVIVFGTDSDKESQVFEYFENRRDFLVKRSITLVTNNVVEEFKYGRKDGLKRLYLKDKPTCYEFYDVRTDCLVKRNMKNGLYDYFSLRNDLLIERTYNNNLYVNKYNSSNTVDQLEFNILSDTVKLTYKQTGDLDFRPYVLLEKNSYSSESKDSFDILECASYDLKSTTALKSSVKQLYHFITYEIKKILNERTEVQTKMDNILKDRSVQEKILNGYETDDLITTKKAEALNLVEAFMAKENPLSSMTAFLEKQYQLRLKILHQKLKDGSCDIEIEVIQSRIDKMQLEKSQKLETFRKRMSEGVKL